MDTNKIIVYVKTEHSYVDFGKNVEIHVTWNYELEGPLPTGKDKDVIRLMKNN